MKGKDWLVAALLFVMVWAFVFLLANAIFDSDWYQF